MAETTCPWRGGKLASLDRLLVQPQPQRSAQLEEKECDASTISAVADDSKLKSQMKRGNVLPDN